MSDQIENRVIDAKSRGCLRGAGHGAAAPDLRAPPVGDPQRKHARPVHQRSAAGSAACLYEGKLVRPRVDACSRSRCLAGSGTAVTGEVTVELRRGDDYTHARHQRAAVHELRARQAVDGEDRRGAAFSPEDRIGALELQNLSVGDNRALLLHHLASVARLGAGGAAAELGGLLEGGKA
jgi:argininosuccinate synthase